MASSLMIKIVTFGAIFAICASLPTIENELHDKKPLPGLRLEKGLFDALQLSSSLQQGEKVGEGTQKEESKAFGDALKINDRLTEEVKQDAKELKEGKEEEGKKEDEQKCLAKCREEEEGKKGEKSEKSTTGIVMLCCILAVIIITVLFETAEHNLVHHTPKTFLPVLTALFSELTVNGFIGVLVFFLTAADVIEDGPGEKKSVLKWLSGQLFSGEEKWETLPEIFEKVHMIIFANMLVLMMTTVGGLGFSIWTRNVGQKMEEYCHDVLAQQHFNKSQADHARDADQSSAQKALAEKEHIKQIATEPPGWTPGWYGTGQYFHLRQRFVLISQQDWDFDFASYCSSALSHVFIETIEIPKMAWLLVALFISAAWAVEHWALGDKGKNTAALIVGLDYALCVGIGLLWARTVWMRKQLSPQRPQYAADQKPQLTASWNDDQQSVSEEWTVPPIEAQVHAVLRVGVRIEHATRPHKTWTDTSGLGSVVEVIADDPSGKPFKVKYDNGEVLQYSALTAVKLRKVHEGERLLESSGDVSIDGVRLNPKWDAHRHADDTQIDPMKYLYFGIHEGAEKLQVLLSNVYLSTMKLISNSCYGRSF